MPGAPAVSGSRPDARTATLAALTAVAALLAIVSAPWALGQPWMNMVFKPLATIGIIAYAAGRGLDTPVLRRWVLAGLVASLAGDIALLWPERGFLPGLVGFLVAHLCYLVAFTRGLRLAARPLPFVIYAAVAGAVLAWLWPGIPAPLRLPVVAYVVALAAMAAQAAVRWRAGLAGPWLAAGGAQFLASDALLAADRFAEPLPMASLWVLTTYWAAQWCIASSLAPARR
ncbi:MAG: lysoplasmalogenase [Burkholderiales bacterium]|nr:lysoplasmalogenase [Burkholderiales bacterium]